MISHNKRRKKFSLKSRKKRREEVMSKILFSILTLVLAIILVYSGVKANIRRKRLEAKAIKLREKIAQLEKEEESLKKGISNTQKESYWEGKIRQEGYAKKGETLVVVLPPKNKENEKVRKESEKVGFWRKLEHIFQNIKEHF